MELYKLLFFGGAGGAHAGGGPMLRLIIVDAEPLVLTALFRGSPISLYNCLGMSSGGLYQFENK